MSPLIVALVGSAQSVPGLLDGLKRRLICRGFQVHLLEAAQREIVGDGDILLVPCRVREVEQLARQLEREWTNQWLGWYAAQKRFPRFARKPAPGGQAKAVT